MKSIIKCASSRIKLHTKTVTFFDSMPSCASSAGRDNMQLGVPPPSVGPYFMHKLLTTGEHYDCSFKVNNKVYKCHKQIFCWASPAFKVAFEGPFSESSQGPDDCIPITNVSEEGFECCLKYLYCNERQFPSLKIAAEVHLFANMWQIWDLEQVAEVCFEESKPDKFCAMHLACKNAGNPIMMERYMEKICQNFSEVSTVDSWLQVPNETMTDILTQVDHKFNILSEMQLVEALLHWGKKQRAKIKPMLPHVRFYSISYMDLSLRYKDVLSKVFTNKEIQSIRTSVYQKKPSLLPNGYSQCMEARTMHQQRRDVIWKYRIEEFQPEAPGRIVESDLKFWVEDDVYLLGIFHFIVDEANVKNRHHYEVTLKTGKQVLNKTTFNGVPTDYSSAGCCIVFNYPTLLKAEVPYQLIVSNKMVKGPKHSASLLACCSNVWKSTVTNIHFMGNNRTGEIFGLSLGCILAQK